MDHTMKHTMEHTMEPFKVEYLKMKSKYEKTKELLYMYRHDILTNLKMRRDFEFDLNDFFDSGIPFYLTLVDVNNLHLTNREEGYDAGDKLITRVAHKIVQQSSGVVYRIGGDEFVTITVSEPKIIEDPTFVHAYNRSEAFKSTGDLFKSVDDKVTELKNLRNSALGCKNVDCETKKRNNMCALSNGICFASGNNSNNSNTDCQNDCHVEINKLENDYLSDDIISSTHMSKSLKMIYDEYTLL